MTFSLFQIKRLIETDSPEELVDGLAEVYGNNTSSIWESIVPAPAELDALVEE